MGDCPCGSGRFVLIDGQGCKRDRRGGGPRPAKSPIYMVSSRPHLLPIKTPVPHTNSIFPTLQWRPRHLLSPRPDACVLDWLFDEGSLTRRLTRLSDEHFSVTPLFEGWQSLREDECAALDLAPGSEGWVREVYLRGHGEPWVFARSVAARSALQGDGLQMDELGSRSLGELLFCDQAFQRGPSRYVITPSRGCRARCAPLNCGAGARASIERR